MGQLETRTYQREFDTWTLEELSRRHGLEGLLGRLAIVLDENGLANNELIERSLNLGLRLHVDDRRTHEPYNNHLVRVTLRLFELNVIDPDILAAGPLHDSIEDHTRELAMMETNDLPDDPRIQRKLAHAALSRRISPAVANNVLGVSNPLLEPNDDKIESYVKNARILTSTGEPEPRALKLADFLDNTDTPREEDRRKRYRLDVKQLPVYGLHALSVERKNSLIVGEYRERVLKELAYKEENARKRLGLD
jgi:(p)ppGpp synthase/HD superfamily hydrolase